MTESLSHGQLTFFLGFAATTFLYIVAELLHYLKGSAIYVSHVESAETAVEAAYKKDESLPLLTKPTTPNNTSTMSSVSESGLVRCLTLDRVALQEHRGTLKAMVEMGCLMCLYFLCDRTTVFQTSEKDYSRDVFLFMFLILTCVAYGSSRQQFKMPLLLNRPQTEEWKGWMQVGSSAPCTAPFILPAAPLLPARPHPIKEKNLDKCWLAWIVHAIHPSPAAFFCCIVLELV